MLGPFGILAGKTGLRLALVDVILVTSRVVNPMQDLLEVKPSIVVRLAKGMGMTGRRSRKRMGQTSARYRFSTRLTSA